MNWICPTARARRFRQRQPRNSGGTDDDSGAHFSWRILSGRIRSEGAATSDHRGVIRNKYALLLRTGNPIFGGRKWSLCKDNLDANCFADRPASTKLVGVCGVEKTYPKVSVSSNGSSFAI